MGFLSGSDPVDDRLVVDPKQASDAPEAVLFQIQTNGLFSKSGIKSARLRVLDIAVFAVLALKPLLTRSRFAVFGLTMRAATRGADKRC